MNQQRKMNEFKAKVASNSTAIAQIFNAEIVVLNAVSRIMVCSALP
jgi:hypothetical protein